MCHSTRLTPRFPAPPPIQPNIFRYDEDEWNALIEKDAEWSRQETDYLLDLCERFDLRFPVIADRYNVSVIDGVGGQRMQGFAGNHTWTAKGQEASAKLMLRDSCCETTSLQKTCYVACTSDAQRVAHQIKHACRSSRAALPATWLTSRRVTTPSLGSC